MQACSPQPERLPIRSTGICMCIVLRRRGGRSHRLPIAGVLSFALDGHAQTKEEQGGQCATSCESDMSKQGWLPNGRCLQDATYGRLVPSAGEGMARNTAISTTPSPSIPPWLSPSLRLLPRTPAQCLRAIPDSQISRSRTRGICTATGWRIKNLKTPVCVLDSVSAPSHFAWSGPTRTHVMSLEQSESGIPDRGTRASGRRGESCSGSSPRGAAHPAGSTSGHRSCVCTESSVLYGAHALTYCRGGREVIELPT